jgi:hypothetical protein
LPEHDKKPRKCGKFSVFASLYAQDQATALLGFLNYLELYFFFDTPLKDVLNAIAYIGPNYFIQDLAPQNSGMYDLSGRGSGYSNLQSVSETFPRVGIVARELDPAHEAYRTLVSSSRLQWDRSVGSDIQDLMVTAYYLGSLWAYYDALYYDTFIFSDGTINPDYTNLAQTLYWISDEFAISAFIIDYSGILWKIVNGSVYEVAPGDWRWMYSDGVLPEADQLYPNTSLLPTYVNVSSNHFLVTRTSAGKDAIAESFNKVGFNNTIPNPSISISPTAGQAPANGSFYNFKANVTGGSVNLHIKWYEYRPGSGGGELLYLQEKKLAAPPGSGGWVFIGAGSWAYSIKPISGYKLKAEVTDQITGIKATDIEYW